MKGSITMSKIKHITCLFFITSASVSMIQAAAEMTSASDILARLRPREDILIGLRPKDKTDRVYIFWQKDLSGYEQFAHITKMEVTGPQCIIFPTNQKKNEIVVLLTDILKKYTALFKRYTKGLAIAMFNIKVGDDYYYYWLPSYRQEQFESFLKQKDEICGTITIPDVLHGLFRAVWEKCKNKDSLTKKWNFEEGGYGDEVTALLKRYYEVVILPYKDSDSVPSKRSSELSDGSGPSTKSSYRTDDLSLASAKPGTASHTNAKEKYNTGLSYLRGTNGKAKNIKRATDLFRAAAALGNAKAVYALGLMYLKGEADAGIKRDEEQARNHFARAVEKGHEKAASKLASMDAKGSGGGGAST